MAILREGRHLARGPTPADEMEEEPPSPVRDYARGKLALLKETSGLLARRGDVGTVSGSSMGTWLTSPLLDRLRITCAGCELRGMCM